MAKLKPGYLSAPELLDLLCQIFPTFLEVWAADTTEDNPDDLSPTYHQIFFSFTPFFGVYAPSATSDQLLHLSEFINRAVETDDYLENAVSTGFLEHLHQIDAVPFLRKHLNSKALSQVRA